MKHYFYLLIFISFILGSCASYQDHFTLTETIATKVMIENLLQRANTPFSENEAAVNDLQQQLQRMQIYENTKNKNTIMKSMWQLLNKEESSLQQFLKTWQAQETMSRAFVTEYEMQINTMLDLMIDYESKKEKQTESALLQFLNP